MLTESEKAKELAKIRSKKMRFPSVAMNQNPKKKKKPLVELYNTETYELLDEKFKKLKKYKPH